MASTRSIQWDIIKGFAIFVVIASHVLYYGMYENACYAFKLMQFFHLPLFFFVSGWFLYKTDDNGALILPSLAQRALRLLPPMLVVAFIYSLLKHPEGISAWQYYAHGMLSASKLGYWFPYTLFIFICIYWCIGKAYGNKPVSSKKLIVIFAAIWALIFALCQFLPATIANATSMVSLRLHLPAFVAGILARRHSTAFYRRSTDSRWLTTALVAISVAAVFVAVPNRTFAGQAIVYVLIYQPAILGVALLATRIAAAMAAPRTEGRPGVWARMWAYVGRHSFALYLLHYLFLFPMPNISAWLQAAGEPFIPLLVIAGGIGAAITAITLVLDYILRLSPWTAYLLCGEQIPTHTTYTKQ